MNQMSPINVSVNGQFYDWPLVPAIAICLDGCEPAYLDEAIKAGLMPALVRTKAKGTATDGGDPPSRQFAAVKKNETSNHGKTQNIAKPSLIRWSIQEVRRTTFR